MKNKSKVFTKKKVFLFIRTVLISVSVFLILIVICATSIKSTMKPPVIKPENIIIVPMRNDNIDSIPVSNNVSEPDSDTVEVHNFDDMAYFPPESDEEDMLIGDGLHAPEGFTSNDRKEQFYTFLILGTDEGINTDTIMVASYDDVNKEANIVGIPRDSMVNVKRNIKKINAAYPAGTLNDGGMEGGINQLKRELKTIIGFMPDFYICIDLDAFVKIVDAVGGVYVDVPLNMRYDDPIQNLYINISKGGQLLDGENALKFARYRKGNDPNSIISDYQRIENQQAVIKGIFTKLLNPANILKIPEFINIFNENVYSDIKLENMLWFADQLNKIKGTQALSTYTLPTCGSSGLPMYYEYLDEPAIIELVNKTINPYKIDIKASDLDIINY